MLFEPIKHDLLFHGEHFFKYTSRGASGDPSNLSMVAIENILNSHIVPSVEWKSTVTTSFSHATHADPSTCIILIILGPSLPYLYFGVFPGGDAAAPQT